MIGCVRNGCLFIELYLAGEIWLVCSLLYKTCMNSIRTLDWLRIRSRERQNVGGGKDKKKKRSAVVCVRGQRTLAQYHVTTDKINGLLYTHFRQ